MLAIMKDSPMPNPDTSPIQGEGFIAQRNGAQFGDGFVNVRDIPVNDYLALRDLQLSGGFEKFPGEPVNYGATLEGTLQGRFPLGNIELAPHIRGALNKQSGENVRAGLTELGLAANIPVGNGVFRPFIQVPTANPRGAFVGAEFRSAF